MWVALDIASREACRIFIRSISAASTIPMPTETAHAMCRRLAREEGLLVGISAGAALAAALHVAEQLEEGVVVTVFPDSAAKYLSDPFWTEEEKE